MKKIISILACLLLLLGTGEAYADGGAVTQGGAKMTWNHTSVFNKGQLPQLSVTATLRPPVHTNYGEVSCWSALFGSPPQLTFLRSKWNMSWNRAQYALHNYPVGTPFVIICDEINDNNSADPETTARVILHVKCTANTCTFSS